MAEFKAILQEKGFAGVNWALENPYRDRKLTATVEGGELLAFGSANPCTAEQYHSGSSTTYYGRALAIVRAGENGTVKVTATDGRASVSTQIQIV